MLEQTVIIGSGSADDGDDGEKVLEETVVARVEEAAPPPDSSPEPADIIVADDSELALSIITDVLTKAGFHVRQAADGRQALELARTEKPALMILDGLMPGKTGFDVCKEVKESLYPDSPPRVLILSAIYTKRQQKYEAMDLYRVDEVLAKPFEDAQFVETVRRHLAAP